MAKDTNRSPWAYNGTDDDASPENTYPLSPHNSIPALVVWLTMTISSDIQNHATDSQLQALADAMGITKKTVVSIRKLLSSTQSVPVNGKKVRICDAFAVVAQAFLQIGKNNIASGQTPIYPPTVCPTIENITKLFGPVGGAVTPSQNLKAEARRGSPTTHEGSNLTRLPLVGYVVCGLIVNWRRKRMLTRFQ